MAVFVATLSVAAQADKSILELPAGRDIERTILLELCFPKDTATLPAPNSNSGRGIHERVNTAPAPVSSEMDSDPLPVEVTARKAEGMEMRERHRDSACVLSPLSLVQTKAAATIPPVLTIAHYPQETSPELMEEAKPRVAAPSLHSDSAISDTESSTPVVAPATVSEGQGTDQEAAPLFVPKSRCSEPQSLGFRSNVHSKLQTILDTDVFRCYPPKDLDRINKDVQKAIPSEIPLPSNLKIDWDLPERLLAAQCAHWEPVKEHVESEWGLLTDLKKQALEKLTTRIGVQKSASRVRMGLRTLMRGRKDTTEIHRCYIALHETELDLDKQIAEIHDIWRQKATELAKYVDDAFLHEFHYDEIEAQRKAVVEEETARKNNFVKSMTLAGWGGRIACPDKGAVWTPGSVTVPNWFHRLESVGVVKLNERQPEARYQEFLAHICTLQRRAENEVASGIATQSEPAKLQKEWHEADPRWPYTSWQTKGGWWVCRIGPDASAPEIECRRCAKKRGTTPARRIRQEAGEMTAAEEYKKIMAEMEKAMSRDMKRDRAQAIANMEAKLREINSRAEAPRFTNGWDGGYISCTPEQG